MSEFFSGLVAATPILHTSDGAGGLSTADAAINNIFKKQDKPKAGELTLANSYSLELKVTGKSNITTAIGVCQKVAGINCKRAVDEIHSGGENDTVYYAAGEASYGDVTLSGAFTDDSFFLTWLTAGLSNNAIYKGDLTIRTPKPHSEDVPHWEITLYGVFPYSWSLSDFTTKNGEIKLIFEDIKLKVSRIGIKYETVSSSTGG